MKKFLLLIIAMAGSLLPVSAKLQIDDMGPLPGKRIVSKASEANISRAAEDQEYVFSYCGNIVTALGYRGVTIEGAIEIPENLSQQWIGNKAIGMVVGFGESNNDEIKIYLTDDLNGYPIILQTENVTGQRSWNKYYFEEPYVIDGNPFYIGYQTRCSVYGGDYPLGVDWDTQAFNEYSDLVSVNGEWDHLGELGYGNVCIKLIIEGDVNIPENLAEIIETNVPDLVILDETFNPGFQILNKGGNPINTLEYSFMIGGEEKGGVFTFDQPLKSGDAGWIQTQDIVLTEIEENIPIEASILKVNGEELNPSEKTSFNTVTNCVLSTYKQNVLVEEFTGTWCGYCPLGIVGMEYMNENYGDQGFIGVAAHDNDEMVSPSYLEVNQAYSRGSDPSCMVNRKYYCSPSKENLEEYFLQEIEQNCIAQIELEAIYVKETNSIDITSSTVFAINVPDSEYTLAFGIAENNVGPYFQNNYYAGAQPGSNTYLEGWSDKKGMVETIFNEVGRVIVNPFGIKNSLPPSIKKNDPMSYSISIENTGIRNLNNCYVIGMILDGNSRVLNSAKLDEIKDAYLGVDQLPSDKAGVYRIYNTQGIKVAESTDPSVIESLAKGVYIMNGKKILKK